MIFPNYQLPLAGMAYKAGLKFEQFHYRLWRRDFCFLHASGRVTTKEILFLILCGGVVISTLIFGFAYARKSIIDRVFDGEYSLSKPGETLIYFSVSTSEQKP